MLEVVILPFFHKAGGDSDPRRGMGKKERGYDPDAELEQLQSELVKFQEWVKHEKLKVCA